MISELVKGSFLAKKSGALAWWEGAGRPAIVVMTDPPYALVGSSMSTRLNRGAVGRTIKYGALTPEVRRGISCLAAWAEWSMIYGMLCDMGNWRSSIEKVGGAWCGVGIVKQTRGAPRSRGDAPGVRHLGLAIARKKRSGAKWAGRPWAEYAETRPASVAKRPIPGTRAIDPIKEMITDMVESCSRTPVVVDPCAGTGVVLMAARALGLPAIGWEVDGPTWEYAQRVIRGQGFSVEGQIDLQMTIDS